MARVRPADGIDAVYFVAQENYPVEFLEQGYPVRLLRYGINRDSGGPGKFRGGAGVVREYEVLAEHAVLSMRIDSVVNPPWGVGGGMRGGTGRAVVNPGTPHERKLAPLSDGTVLRRGDILLLETGGGGGHGHPFDRPAEQVLQDVRDGFVSVGAARRDYGVAIAGDAVDEAATRSLRATRRSSPSPCGRGLGEGADDQSRIGAPPPSPLPRGEGEASRNDLHRRGRYRRHLHRHHAVGQRHRPASGAPRLRARRRIRRRRSSPA